MKEKRIKHFGALLVLAGFCVCLSMCAKIEDPTFDTVSEYTIRDLPYDPAADSPSDFVPDIPMDTPYDMPADVPYDPGSCTESPCCLYPNGGCPAGQKCSLDPATVTRTCMTAGTGTLGSTCEGAGDEDCAAGYLCLGTNEAGTTGACFPYCGSDANCSGDGAVCLPIYSGGSAVEGASYCSYSCNLVSNAGCPPGHGCDLFSWDQNSDTVPDVSLTDCTGDVGYGSQGAYCAQEADCGSTFTCYPTESICLGWCYGPGGMSTCTGGATCTNLDPPAIIGTQEAGICY